MIRKEKKLVLIIIESQRFLQIMMFIFHLGLALGENCTDDTECLDENAYCDSIEGVCTCEPGTYASDSTGMCEDGMQLKINI